MSLDRLTGEQRAAMGERLKAARYLAGKTMRGVADALAVSVNSVVQWEHGAVPNPPSRAKLAALYGVDEDLLFAEVAALDERARQLLRPA